MLKNWDFKDPELNSTTPQINRQKSARNLTVISIDMHNAIGVFFDAKKGTKNTATLNSCDCIDFNFSGRSPRKTFKPCMHIYCLAIELGLLEMKYEDGRSKVAKIAEQKQSDTDWLKAQIETKTSGEDGIESFMRRVFKKIDNIEGILL